MAELLGLDHYLTTEPPYFEERPECWWWKFCPEHGLYGPHMRKPVELTCAFDSCRFEAALVTTDTQDPTMEQLVTELEAAGLLTGANDVD